jgi:hypothetical protein
VIASEAPATNSAAASASGEVAIPAPTTNTAMPIVPTTATRDERYLRIRVAAASPAISAPPENAAIAAP